ncbi:MAG: aspartate-semialdehyde dehydrogenase [Salinispira sp.]
MSKIPVAVLGATGTVGQKFVTLLKNHPQFEMRELVASPRSAGKSYKEAVRWKQDEDIPAAAANMTVLPLDSELQSRILFSGLDSSVAGEAESRFAAAGHIVISNSKNHRMDPLVPLVIPEINADHFALMSRQPGKGAIITNSNCSTMFLTMALAPLHEAFGLESVQVSTMQAISGAGYPGTSGMDILGNVIPYIPGEEDKLETEPLKILGALTETGIRPASFTLSAQCNRVPVSDGHSENVSIQFRRQNQRSPHPSPADVKEVLRNFTGGMKQRLYSSPESFIVLRDNDDRPQPLLDLHVNKGMSVVVGRIRPCPVMDMKMTILGHNTIRGAAGAAILNAEAMLALGYVR